MLLTDARNRLSVDLSDKDKTLLEDDVLDRSIQRSVSDMSKFLPRERMLEITLVFTVTGEEWASAKAAGTYVTLANRPIKRGSEAVKNNLSATMVRDTDYTMDYTNGRITHISGGDIGNDKSCTISYAKSDVIVSISSIIEDLIRVDRVEYPVGGVPQTFVPYEQWGDLLTILSGPMDTQESMTANEHLVVYYSSKHTAPTPTADGTYPDFLDDTVLLAASAYALFSLSVKYMRQSVTDMASMRTALGKIAAVHLLAVAALGKVTTEHTHVKNLVEKAELYLEANENDGDGSGKDNAVAILSDVTDDLDELRTKINNAANAVTVYLGKVTTLSLDKATTGAEAYLDTGDEKIPSLNTAARVSEKYSDYARARVDIANTRIAQAAAYAQEASVRLSNLRSYLEESGAWTKIAETFIAAATLHAQHSGDYVAEAQGRIAQMDKYLSEANQYREAANMGLVLAEKFREEAIERRNEAWSVWRDPKQFSGLLSRSPARQPTR